MSGSLVADLGLSPEVWLFLSMLSCFVLFFKFGRFWSVRNVDLVLLFAPAPGLMWLVGQGATQPWWAFVWLFLGSFLWFVRCLIDLGLLRRPLLEPNLNAGGLACLTVGMLGLLLVEAVNLPKVSERARNPADPHARRAEPIPPAPPAEASSSEKTVHQVLSQAPPPGALKRFLAVLAHLGLVAGLIAVGWRHFERPIAGLAVAGCYLILPYTRIAVADSGQVVPAALIVSALVAYQRPVIAGALIGLAAAWMPAALGLIPLWAGFYKGRGIGRFLISGLAVVGLCGALALSIAPLATWARALGARSLAEAGLLPGIEGPNAGSFWTGVDPVYRLPVLIAYLALVITATVWPSEKDLGQLIALSAALLIASQFWYLEEGGALVLLYLPLLLLMIFRPNLSSKRAIPRTSTSRTKTLLFPVR